MYRYFLNGVDITDLPQFEFNGAKFSTSLLDTLTDAELESMGITKILEVPKTKDQINAEISAEIVLLQNRIVELTATLIP